MIPRRIICSVCVALLAGVALAQDAAVAPPQPFEVWLDELMAEARARGFPDALIDQALAGVEPLPRVIDADRSQAELRPGLDRYLSTRLTPDLIRRGRQMARTYPTLLGRIEARFGVQRRFVLAVWGLETRYGRVTGTTPVFRALATLAWEPRRADFFRGQLFDALTMVQRGYIDVPAMTGSWAGAMGQTQFMPSSYLQYAVDFDGDGRRDIWKSVPDALASIANYLSGHGWNGEETWGREVRVGPAVRQRIAETIPGRTEGCSAFRSMTERRPLAYWQELGVRRADGSALPTAEIDASLIEVDNRTFIVYRNYEAILGYNCAHFYALSVAMLGDRLR